MLDAEPRTKRESLAAPAAVLEDALVVETERCIAPGAGASVRTATRYLASRLATRADIDTAGYLRHAMRVARITLRWDPRPSRDTLALAILHNVHEVAGSDGGALAGAGLSPHVIAGIGALTIDRPRDEDEDYLCGFYAAIERAGPDVALVRCADKIDNLLDYGAGSDPRRVRYVDLSERFVLPIAYRLSDPLGRFFASVVERARRGW